MKNEFRTLVKFHKPYEAKKKKFSQARRNFSSLAKLMNFATPCETFASQKEFRKPCETDEFRNPLQNFRKQCEIFLYPSDIFTLTLLDFYLKIFRVITYSLLVIS